MTTDEAVTTAADTYRAQNPGSIPALAADIAQLRLSPVDLVTRYLDRIEAVNPDVECWAELDGDRALEQAKLRQQEAEAGQLRGPLHGIPVAIKDMFDVEGLRTRANSRVLADVAPARGDAELVLWMRNQGAVILGKVHTTEFAYFDPSPARNPQNTDHTPGGSSSGSGAVVSAGMAPLSIGSQTVASLNRPAAYCGISAFKPSTASMPTAGGPPLAPSYDTPGVYGWTVDDAVYAYEAVAPRFVLDSTPERSELNVVVLEDPHIDGATDDVKRSVRGAADAAANAGHRVQTVTSPVSFARLHYLHISTVEYEMGRNLRYLIDLPEGSIGPKLHKAIADGAARTMAQYLDERKELDALRAQFFSTFADVDAFLWPATPDAAPRGLETTGDPSYISPWTALGPPIVTMPVEHRSDGMPLGLLIAGQPGRDHALGRAARRIAEVAQVAS